MFSILNSLWKRFVVFFKKVIRLVRNSFLNDLFLIIIILYIIKFLDYLIFNSTGWIIFCYLSGLLAPDEIDNEFWFNVFKKLTKSIILLTTLIVVNVLYKYRMWNQDNTIIIILCILVLEYIFFYPILFG